MTDTIFAPATAPGRAALAIIRVSGPAAGEALRALAGSVPPPRRARRARFRDPRTGEPIDDGLALFFPAPASATGEDVAELHLHGGRAVLEAAASALLAVPGLRLAEPGEFTRRAFENGKLDLTAAEAVADLVAAETAAQRRQSLAQLEGALGRLYDGWRGRLMRALAHLEAAIDFPEEDLPAGIDRGVRADVEALVAEITAHLTDERRGEILREGVEIAIIGPPNAGKSSLLNALARRDVAITSAVAGTTRDVIEVRLDLAGYPVILADTAGLRAASDAIEEEGVRRARQRAARADLKLVVFDVTRPSELAALGDVLDAATILVANKVDLATADDIAALAAEAAPLSIKTGEGMSALLDRLQAAVARRIGDGSGPALTRARHRRELEDCAAALRRALTAALPELAGEDLRLALRSLGRITGRVDVEDILDVIFRDFCIGK
ncbi:MAG TPA: tRNA uridine-5-carboxymethylaminomethyl(34) synthesis GTPase MnmE [Stellaceae bacterium]|nr:tRNA uridine-5-carboxymethylaminomethyl(34) synthesis GTPase MnmE [Stellaceae bacterium]